MAKLTDALVSEFARIMAPKPKRPTSSYVFGTARNNGQHQVEVKVNGDDTYRVMKSSVKVKDGDKVAVLVKNRTGLVTSNITTPSMNANTGLSSISFTSSGGGEVIGAADEGSFYSPNVEEQDEGEYDLVELFTDDEFKYINFGPEDGTTTFHRVTADYAEYANADIQSGSIRTLNCENAYADDISYTNMAQTSDRNLKKDISDTEEKNALDKINKIRHRQFKWKYGDEQIDLGYIAQELDEIDPNLDSVINGRHGVNISYLLPLMTKAIQELSTEVEELRKEVKRLGKA